MIDKDYVFCRIGMALVSTQRVEFMSDVLLRHLAEFDKEVYGITSDEFLNTSQKSIKARMTLGSIFKLLELNPKLIIKDELDDYLGKRNIFIHSLWKNYLNTISVDQAKRAIAFCNDFCRHSNRVESFFKGFLFFLALKHVEDRSQVIDEVKSWDADFEYFLSSLDLMRLVDGSN
jgi:hypothetical protein